MEKLMFRNRELTREPTNISMEDLASLMRTGQSAVVILEPGDATRYRLMLVPCDSKFVRTSLCDIGIPAPIAREYIFVCKYDDETGQSFWARRPKVEEWELPFSNEWTRRFLAWWMEQLWKEIG